MQRDNCELTEVYHCIIHQENLCSKVLKIEHIVITAVNSYNGQTDKSLPISVFL